MNTSTERNGPRYLRIVDGIRTKIRSGEYPTGAQLPTKAALLDEYKVALGTLDRAIEVLRGEGLIETFHGVGMFVKTVVPPEPATATADDVTELKGRVAHLEAQVMDIYASIGGNYQAPENNAEAG